MTEQIILPFETKRCHTCKQYLPQSEFHANQHATDGRAKQCKKCKKIRSVKYNASDKCKERVKRSAREWATKNREKRRGIVKRSNARHGQKRREYRRKYKEANKARIKESNKLYRQANKEKINASNRNYRKDRRDDVREWNRRQYYKDVEKMRAYMVRYAHKRRLQGTEAGGHYTIGGWLAKCAYHGWRCYLCHKPLTSKTVTIEHRIPVSRGGSNWLSNLAPACLSCNARKHDKTEHEYREWLSKILVA